MVLLPPPPKYLGLQVCADTPALKDTTFVPANVGSWSYFSRDIGEACERLPPVSSKASFSSLSRHQSPLQGLLKQIPGPHPQVSVPLGLAWACNSHLQQVFKGRLPACVETTLSLYPCV
jgi:hypothetical protein